MRALTLLLLPLIQAITPNLNPIKCINYYGFETERKRPVCDWVHQPDFYLKTLKEYLDINTIRLPFSYEYVNSGDLSGMDSFINLTTTYQIQIILDYHRTWATHQGPEPLENVSMSQISKVWSMLASRYYDNPYVIGLGVFNEYQGRNKTYLNLYHRTITAFVEKHHPGRYYFFLGCATWGHDCNGIEYNFPNISMDRIYIDFHTYHFIYDKWQDDNLQKTLYEQLPITIPPSNIFVGEFGWKQDVQSDKDWALEALKHFKLRNITSICGWTIAHSGDTGGWFNDDCMTFRYDKADILKSFWDNSWVLPTPQCPACECPSIWSPPRWPWRILNPASINSTSIASLRGHK